MGWGVDRGPALRRWAGPIPILLAALWMLRLTWLTWPDPIVDFGRELYVPWSLVNGHVLYSDIAYYNGPLSPYLNALWFTIDGVGLASLIHLNLMILMGVLWLLYRMLGELASTRAAALGCVTFVVLFAFGQLTGIGNYNWVCPYSHEMTHGIALSLLAIHLVARYARHGAPWCAAASGAAIGLVFLTKGEVFLAGSVATAGGMLLATRSRPPGRRSAALACWTVGALLPIAASWMLLSLAMPAAEALRGTFSVWIHAFDARNLAQPFYRTVSGTDQAVIHAGRLLMVAAGSAAALAPAGLIAQRTRSAGARRIGAMLAVALVWGSAFALAGPVLPWNDWLRPLPLWMLLLFAGGLLRLVSRRDEPGTRHRAVLALALLCFAGLLLIKMVLNVRVGHYGFGLAMPGTVLLAVALVDWLPRWIDRRGGCGAVFASAAAVVWIGILAGHYGFIAHFVGEKTVRVGSGADAFRADARGAALAEAVRRIDSRLEPGQTLTTFVDCEMLNYLTRRRSSVRYSKFIPQELLMFGESNMLDELRNTPPDYVAVVHAETSEYGPRFFGRDYGLELWEWIESHYQPLGRPIGAEPMQGDRFGIALMRRRRDPAP